MLPKLNHGKSNYHHVLIIQNDVTDLLVTLSSRFTFYSGWKKKENILREKNSCVERGIVKGQKKWRPA